MSAADRRAAFRALHEEGIFALPNAWDAGSARLLESVGAVAVATTSAGFAWTLGRADGDVTRDELVAHVGAVVAATRLPVSVDSERLFADDHAGVAETVRMLAGAGAAGCSIEDWDPGRGQITPLQEAAARVVAAATAAQDEGLVLTARAENLLHGVEDLEDTIARLDAYRAAGADVVYAPGLTSMAEISAVVTRVAAPVNVLALPGVPEMDELRALGVRRVSTGSLLASAAYAAAARGATSLVEDGTYPFQRDGLPRELRDRAFGAYGVHRHPDYTRRRIAQVCERLRARVRCEVCEPVRLEVAGPVGRIPLAEAETLEYRPASPGEQYGPLWATYWFRIEAVVPEQWAGERVDLLWVSHSEATLWVDGRPVQGLNTSPDGARPDALLIEAAAGGERLDLRVELACNGKFGELERVYETVEPVVLDQCVLARFDPLAWRLHHDLDVLRRLEADGAAHGDLDPAWGGRLLAQLNSFCNAWDEDDRATWAPAGEILAPLLAARNGTVTHELAAVGHAHIDTAWLWPLAETHRKMIRSFSSQLAYMERYPEFQFACSQAYQYDWLRLHQPELYARIHARVASGQWVPCGGTWIEPDCNLPSGESLVRQFLYGQRYFEREFGRRHREFWNPDVFGYNAQLPQIMRGAGIDRFLTQKLSWNRFTRPDHHTFDWEAPDGSRVLAHFPPIDTYNATATVEELRRNARAHLDHDFTSTSLLIFGYGDGGGGPTPDMLESLRRVADLQGVARTAIRTPEEFFTDLDAGSADRPVVLGELYLEFHRGTYTTQAAVKRGNWAGERGLHDAELLAAVAHRLGAGQYPADRLDEAWQLLLLNQFHDILPGSSIGEVYEDAARDHARVLDLATGVTREATRWLAGGGEPVPVNTTGFARDGVAVEPGGGLARVAAGGCGPGRVVDAPDAVEVEERPDEVVLRNAHLEAVLGRDGALRSLVHRPTGREALAGRGNVLQLFEDRPVAWDAWDVDPFHLETERDNGPARSCTVVMREPLRAELELEFDVGRQSTLTQLVRLDAGSPRLEFHTVVDWREQHTLLKVLFEVDARSPAATYQMQFGATARPTHFSTQRELAQFEVPGHRFADLSESGFGVALLTDCKYGYSTFQNQMRISLLRASTAPDPGADLGEHRFAYAVMPHAGDWRSSGVVAAAAAFESPFHWIDGPLEPRPWVAVADEHLVLDTVKRAEDSDALVLRLYEAHGARGTARVELGVPFGRARLANLLEDPGAELALEGGAIAVPYTPHQIVTVLVD